MSLTKSNTLDITGGDKVKDPAPLYGAPVVVPVIPKTGTTTFTAKPPKQSGDPGKIDLKPIEPLTKISGVEKPDLVGSVLRNKGVQAMNEGDSDALTEAAINAAAVEEARRLSEKLEMKVQKARDNGQEIDVVASLNSIIFMDKISESSSGAVIPALAGTAALSGAGHLLSKTPPVNSRWTAVIQKAVADAANASITGAAPGNIPPVTVPPRILSFLDRLSPQFSNVRRYGVPALGLAGAGLIGSGIYSAGRNYGGINMDPAAAAVLTAAGTGAGAYGLQQAASRYAGNVSGVTALKELPGRVQAAVAGSMPAAGKAFNKNRYRRVAGDAVKNVINSKAFAKNLRNPLLIAGGGALAAGLGAYGLGSAGKNANLNVYNTFIDKKANTPFSRMVMAGRTAVNMTRGSRVPEVTGGDKGFVDHEWINSIPMSTGRNKTKPPVKKQVLTVITGSGKPPMVSQKQAAAVLYSFLFDKRSESDGYAGTLGLAGTAGALGTAGYLGRKNIKSLLTRYPGRGAAAIGALGTGVGALSGLSAGEFSDNPAIAIAARNPVSTGLGLTSLGAGAAHFIGTHGSGQPLSVAAKDYLKTKGVNVKDMAAAIASGKHTSPLMKNIGRLGIGTGAAALLGFALSESARRKNSHIMDYTAMTNRTVLPGYHRSLPYINPLVAGAAAVPLAGGAHALADWAATGELKWSPKYLKTMGAAGVAAPVTAAAYNALTADYDKVPGYRS